MGHACPEPSVLEAFVKGELDGVRRADLELHIDACSDCRFVLTELAHGSSTGISGGSRTVAGEALLLEPGAVVGRYRIERRIGEGAMGVVYAAHDRQLDRRVALKFLRSGHADDVDVQQLRMAREAQATAKLSHTNVVGVYEVGTHEGHLFIALELVDGVTLSRWMSTCRPQRSAVLDAFVAAGRGLQAAHVAGLVHRDFKPDNVLVDGEGRVRVTDFGLARTYGLSAPTEDGPRVGCDPATHRPLTMDLTTRGTIVGTPAYMAPEQFRGLPADARTDQFSYCVALYEALFGKRPFSGTSVLELSANVARGALDEDALRSAPRWLRRCLRRGLSVHRDDRYASMAPLLLELGRDRSLRKRLIVAAALGAGAAGMTGVLYLLAVAGVIAPPDADPPSTNLGATEVGRLAAEARSSGGDAHETGSTGDEGDSIRAELQTIEALIRAGRYADALPMAQAAVTRAREADEGKLLAIAHYREGSLHGYLGDPAAAERSFIDAMLAGKQHDAPDVQSEAAIRLVHVVGYVQRRFDDADPWIRTAQALVDASGDERQQSTLASYIGTVRFAEGDYASAETYQRRALELEEALLGPDHADLASTLNNLAGALAEQGRPEEALPLRERALRIIIAQRGAEHPQVSDHLRGVGALLFQLGRASEAHEHWVRALELRREAYGDEHPDVATSLDDLGNALEALGQDEEAITRLREALAMREKLLGKHPEVAATLSNLGRVLTKTGRNDEAIILHERAVALTEESLGHEHAEVATKLANLAVAYREVGRRDDAVETYARALEIREATLGPEHSQTSRTRALLDTLRAEPR